MGSSDYFKDSKGIFRLERLCSGSLSRLGTDLLMEVMAPYIGKDVILMHRHDYALKDSDRSYESGSCAKSIIESVALQENYVGLIFDSGKLFTLSGENLCLGFGFPSIPLNTLYGFAPIFDAPSYFEDQGQGNDSPITDSCPNRWYSFTFEDGFRSRTAVHHDVISAYLLVKPELPFKACLTKVEDLKPMLLK